MPRKLRLQYPGAIYHVQQATPAGRQEFERHLERRRLEEVDPEALEEFRRSWCIGGEAFRRECLAQMDGQVGENHPGQTRLETAEAKADRIVAEELARLRWSLNDLALLPKSHPSKLALAGRLRQETTLSVKEIAQRLHLGKPKGARANLHKFLNGSAVEPEQAQMDI